MASTNATGSLRRVTHVTGLALAAIITQPLGVGSAPEPLADSSASLLVSTAAGRAAPPQLLGGRRLEVLFLGNTGQLHKSPILASMLGAQWAEQGLNIVHVTDPAVLNPETLGQYDVLVVYGNHENLSPEHEKALLDFVESGKGFVGIHSASACWGNSDKYVALIGGQFKSHGGEEFQAKILEPNHPIFAGIKEFKTWDETYVHQKLNTDLDVLMERVDAAGREPWAWTRTQGKGRVFYTASGHNAKTWENPDYLRLLRNAILWVANPEAVEQLRTLDIKPRVLVPNKIPITNNDSLTGSYQEPIPLAETMKHFQVRPGFELQVFAAEPEISRPMAMNWDSRGRLWIVETMDFPNDKQPLWQGHDRIKILEDTDNDGKADKFTVFADNLSIPTGIVLANDGVVIAAPPEFLFLKDTNGDDKADVREVIMDRWNVGDTHGGPGNLHYGYDNWLWGSMGFAGYERKEGDTTYHFNAGVYRFSPDGKKFEHIVDFSNNTFGYGLNEAFDVFGSTANGEHSTYVVIPDRYYGRHARRFGAGRKKLDGHYEVHPNEPHIRQVDVIGGFTAATGQMFYTARAYPQDYWNSVAIVNEPTAHIIHRADIRPSGSTYAESDGWNLVGTDDDWFMPVQAEVGPDGAIWICDFNQLIVQHFGYSSGVKTGKGAAYESEFRKSNFGRIYRLVYKGKGAKPYQPISLSKDRPQELVAALKNDNMFWRMMAQQLMVERGKTDVVEGVMAIATDASVDPVGLNPPVQHAMWTLHGLGQLNGSNPKAVEIVARNLGHRSGAVRKNALRVLPRTEPMLEAILQSGVLNDPDLQVRLQAFLSLIEYPPSEKIGRLAYQLSKDSVNRHDEWLAEAVALTGLRHEGGFMSAYNEEFGLAHFFKIALQSARGELEDFKNYSAPRIPDSTWRTTKVPLTRETHPMGENAGAMWLRKTIDVPRPREAGQTRLRGFLRLGDLADYSAAIYVNGRRVNRGNRPGDFSDWSPPRNELYLPEGILRYGPNVVAVRLSTDWMHPGVGYDPKNIKEPVLEIAGKTHSLAGDWRIMIEEIKPKGTPRSRPITPRLPIADQLVSLMNPLEGYLAPMPPYAPPPEAAPAATSPAAKQVNDTLYVRLGVKLPMEFDKKLITAKPGQPIKLTFTNNSPDVNHNWVLYKPLSKAALAKEMADFTKDPKKADRQFLPDSRSILQHTKLLDPKASDTIVFTAPSAPGDYPYLCTFPGHWQMMRGILRVAAGRGTRTSSNGKR